MSNITVKELLEELDGNGLIWTDSDETSDALKALGLSHDSVLDQSFSESTEVKILTTDELINQMSEWLIDTDADTLAEYAGKIFGGACYFVDGHYQFFKNSDYMGAFD